MTLRIPKLGVSFLVERQPLWLIACLVLLLFICMLYATGAGSLPIPASDVFKSLIGHGDPLNDLIIREFRLPRVLTAVLAGAALALSGAVMQGMVRNPLASPDLMGITSGAGLAAVVFLNFFSGDWGIHWLPVFAAAGGAIVAGAVFLAAWKGGIAPIRMVLIGVGITALLGSARTIIMLQANIWQAAQSYTWLVGSLHSSSWSSVQMLFICLLVLSPLLFIAVRYINLHTLGDEVALGAGSALQRERILLIALLTALAGAAISFVGGISFVALMSPHIGPATCRAFFRRGAAGFCADRSHDFSHIRFDRPNNVRAARHSRRHFYRPYRRTVLSISVDQSVVTLNHVTAFVSKF